MAQSPTLLSPRDLARMIDISAVQAFHTEADLREVAEAALAEGFIAVHALPHFTALLSQLLPADSGVLVGGPIGFPSGGSLTETKLTEARGLVRDGAAEVDLMMNIGRLKSGDSAYVARELAAVIAAAAPVAPAPSARSACRAIASAASRSMPRARCCRSPCRSGRMAAPMT